MYNIPDSFDPSVFHERTLDLVSFSANSIHFVFENDLAITVEGSYIHMVPDDEAQVDDGGIPVQHSRLMRMVGKRVTSCEVQNQRTLSLSFEDGQVFRCLGDSRHYECYRIIQGEEEIVV